MNSARDSAFGVAAPRLRNSLPACMIKKHLKTQLFNQSYNPHSSVYSLVALLLTW